MEHHLLLTPIRVGGARIVDRGRSRQRAAGIALGGAADPDGQRSANGLLGVPPRGVCIEIPLYGGIWLFSGRGQIALTGADMNWRLNGNPVARYSLIYLDGDYLLTGRQAINGCRAYLAIRGNWSSAKTRRPLPIIRKSRETGLPGTFALHRDQTIRITATGESPFRNELGEPYPDSVCLKAYPGPEYRLLFATQRSLLLSAAYTVDGASDRQGIRLISDKDLRTDLPTLLSSPVLPGTVQLSPAGPILLGPDAQTVGGYPRVLQVDEWHPAFQLRPGQQLRFRLHRSGRVVIQ